MKTITKEDYNTFEKVARELLQHANIRYQDKGVKSLTIKLNKTNTRLLVNVDFEKPIDLNIIDKLYAPTDYFGEINLKIPNIPLKLFQKIYFHMLNDNKVAAIKLLESNYEISYQSAINLLYEVWPVGEANEEADNTFKKIVNLLYTKFAIDYRDKPELFKLVHNSIMGNFKNKVIQIIKDEYLVKDLDIYINALWPYNESSRTLNNIINRLSQKIDISMISLIELKVLFYRIVNKETIDKYIENLIEKYKEDK